MSSNQKFFQLTDIHIVQSKAMVYHEYSKLPNILAEIWIDKDRCQHPFLYCSEKTYKHRGKELASRTCGLANHVMDLKVDNL